MVAKPPPRSPKFTIIRVGGSHDFRTIGKSRAFVKSPVNLTHGINAIDKIRYTGTVRVWYIRPLCYPIRRPIFSGFCLEDIQPNVVERVFLIGEFHAIVNIIYGAITDGRRLVHNFLGR